MCILSIGNLGCLKNGMFYYLNVNLIEVFNCVCLVKYK